MTIPATPPERTEVVVVGAGPTGLTAAIKLAQLGIPHIVLDAASTRPRRRPRRPRRRSSTPRSVSSVVAQLLVTVAVMATASRAPRIVPPTRRRVRWNVTPA